MTIKGLEHVIFVLTECRTKFMSNPDPMIMERIQEGITLCREDIARKKEVRGENYQSGTGK